MVWWEPRGTQQGQAMGCPGKEPAGQAGHGLGSRAVEKPWSTAGKHWDVGKKSALAAGGNRKGVSLPESCVKVKLKMEKCKSAEDVRTRNNRAVSCVEIGLRKIC